MPTLSRNGVRLYFSDSGRGTAVVFHTGGGGDGRMWELAGYPDAIAGCHQVLMDHRGHGRSDQPRRLEEHRIEEYVADLIAVLDAAGVERAVLVGYSGGASAVFAAAAANPDRCLAVIGIGNVPTPQDVDPEPNLAMAAHVRQVGMREAMEEMSAQENEPAPRWLIDNLATTPTEMFALLLEAWANARSSWDDLPGIASPTLIICGEDEYSDEEVHQATSRLPDGKAIRLPGFGHLQTFWHADVTAPLMVDFLRSRVPGF